MKILYIQENNPHATVDMIHTYGMWFQRCTEYYFSSRLLRCEYDIVVFKCSIKVGIFTTSYEAHSMMGTNEQT